MQPSYQPKVEAIPTVPGGYLLELRLTSPARFSSGRFEGVTIPSGIYLYTGSACGPGGLRGRLTRHLRPVESVRPHWHIDHLRQIAVIRAIAWISRSDARESEIECCWAQTLQNLPGADTPLTGFGSSDCRSGCRSHLIAFNIDSKRSADEIGLFMCRPLLSAAVEATEGAIQVLPVQDLVRIP